MTRSTLATLAMLCIGGLVASQMGGREGAGVMAGVVCGAGVSMLGSSWVRHNFVHRPQRAFVSVIETFLFKLAFVLIGALSFRFIDSAASRADWRSFLLAFVATAFLVQTVSVFENVRLLRKSEKKSETPSSTHDEPLLMTSQAGLAPTQAE